MVAYTHSLRSPSWTVVNRFIYVRPGAGKLKRKTILGYFNLTHANEAMRAQQ